MYGTKEALVDNEDSSRVARYLGPARIVSGRVMVFVEALGVAAPKDITVQEKKKLKAVERSAKKVEEVQTAREQQSPARLQGPRLAVITAVGAFYEMLSATGRLPSKSAKEAQFILRSLFPHGPTYVTLAAPELWARVRRLMNRVEHEGLDKRLHTFANTEFLAAIHQAHDALGDAIGLDGRSTLPTTALADAIAAFQVAVAGYARALSASVEEDDPRTLQRFFAAVAPIDEFRSRQTGSTDTETDEEDDVVDEDSDEELVTVTPPTPPPAPIPPPEPPVVDPSLPTPS
jgi:hypothetical protein